MLGREPLLPPKTTAFKTWAEQLDGLTLHKVNLEAREQGGAPNPWVRAGAVADEDLVDVQLWATGDGPILLVSIDRISDEPPRTPAVDDRMESPPAPEPADLGPTGRTDGDELFAEQGGRIHLPEGTTALTPTIPTRAGTGGSTSVVAAEDARAAIDAMLAEGLQRDPDGRVDEPEISELDGVEVITAGYWRDGGGWDFDIVAVRGPADPTATLYITSGSD